MPTSRPAPEPAPEPVALVAAARGVLRLHDFRWLWYSMALSSLGDWLGLLAKTAMATELATGYRAANFALGGVLLSQLLPAVLLGPLAGAFVDRFDRRYTMVFCDVVRFALFVTIPIAHSLTWLFVASFLIESFGMFWRPAKEASVPNLLERKEQVEPANQLSLLTTYGITPVAAAALFATLAAVSRGIGVKVAFFGNNQWALAMYVNAATFVFAAVTVARIRRISDHRGPSSQVADPPSLFALLREGASFVSRSRLIRGLSIGIVGAFAAGGTVISTGKIYAQSLSGGDAAYGLLFGAVFVGLGLGMAFGPRIARGLSRQRLFGVSIVFAGGCLVLFAVMPHLVLAILTVVGVGFGAGVAYLSGMTLLGAEVEDDVRGRTFALVQSMVQVVLIGTLAVVPFLVGVVRQQAFTIDGQHVIIDGTRFLLTGAGLLCAAAGVFAYRQMDDRAAVPLVADVISSLRGDTTARRRLRGGGVFVAFEGGEGSGKTTQIAALAGWLKDRSVAVTETHEPGATPVGGKVRAILLDGEDPGPSPRAEALLFAADRAHHVDTVIRPALEVGRVVLTDRYVDSSLAYQSGGRSFSVEEIRRLSQWATGDLRPDLTILLDVDPAVGLQRAGRRGAADRLERESVDFHRRVAQAFRRLAEASPDRYLVLDATRPPEELAAAVQEGVAALLAERGVAVGTAQRESV